MDEIEAAMVRAYATALKGCHGGAAVSIHVGQEGWDWLKSKAIVEDPSTTLARPWLAKAWGFPVVLEQAWATSRVVVRCDTVIA